MRKGTLQGYGQLAALIAAAMLIAGAAIASTQGGLSIRTSTVEMTMDVTAEHGVMIRFSKPA